MDITNSTISSLGLVEFIASPGCGACEKVKALAESPSGYEVSAHGTLRQTLSHRLGERGPIKWEPFWLEIIWNEVISEKSAVISSCS